MIQSFLPRYRPCSPRCPLCCVVRWPVVAWLVIAVLIAS